MFNENNEAIFTLEALLRINQKDHIALGIMGEALSALGRDDELLFSLIGLLRSNQLTQLHSVIEEHH